VDLSSLVGDLRLIEFNRRAHTPNFFLRLLGALTQFGLDLAAGVEFLLKVVDGLAVVGRHGA
jgi:hypothetical protein